MGPNKNLADILIEEEGNEEGVYTDTKGHPTTGIGFNLDDPVMREILRTSKSDEEALSRRMAIAVSDAQNFIGPTFNELPQPVQRTVESMSYQMGGPSLSGFQKMRQALVEKDYNKAADEVLNSQFAKDTPERAKRNADSIRQFSNPPKGFQIDLSSIPQALLETVKAGPTSFNSITGGPSTEFAHQLKTISLKKAGLPEIVAESLSGATDPQSIIGGMVGLKSLPLPARSLGAAGKQTFINKLSKIVHDPAVNKETWYHGSNNKFIGKEFTTDSVSLGDEALAGNYGKFLYKFKLKPQARIVKLSDYPISFQKRVKSLIDNDPDFVQDFVAERIIKDGFDGVVYDMGFGDATPLPDGELRIFNKNMINIPKPPKGFKIDNEQNFKPAHENSVVSYPVYKKGSSGPFSKSIIIKKFIGENFVDSEGTIWNPTKNRTSDDNFIEYKTKHKDLSKILDSVSLVKGVFDEVKKRLQLKHNKKR